MSKPFLLWLCLFATAISPSRAAEAKAPAAFELKDGDMVAIIGDAFAEREQAWSYLETRLIARWPDRNIRFRNLGWSGDTVFGDARAMFDGPPQGLERLLKAVDDVKPTVIFVCYGMSESFEGEAGLPEFRAGLTRLLDKLQKPGVRIVLVSPIKHEMLPPPLPDPAAHNASLRLYVDAIKEIAQQRGHWFVNLFDSIFEPLAAPPKRPITSNGIHLNGLGYWLAAACTERELGLAPMGWTIDLDFKNQTTKTERVEISDVKMEADTIRFRIPPGRLSPPHMPYTGSAEKEEGGARILRITALSSSPSFYHLYRTARDVTTTINCGNAERWAKGVDLREYWSSENVRAVAVAKNVQYFNQYRPQNYTYIFGFRKHEQGQNAVEIPQFAKPIAEYEAEIEHMRKDVPQTFELKRSQLPKSDP